jgi:hypothetical protein
MYYWQADIIRTGHASRLLDENLSQVRLCSNIYCPMNIFLSNSGSVTFTLLLVNSLLYYCILVRFGSPSLLIIVSTILWQILSKFR